MLILETLLFLSCVHYLFFWIYPTFSSIRIHYDQPCLISLWPLVLRVSDFPLALLTVVAGHASVLPVRIPWNKQFLVIFSGDLFRFRCIQRFELRVEHCIDVIWIADLLNIFHYTSLVRQTVVLDLYIPETYLIHIGRGVEWRKHCNDNS